MAGRRPAAPRVAMHSILDSLTRERRTFDVLGFGEPLMEFSATGEGRDRSFRPGFGGDTSNATIAAARQGAKAAYFTAVGDDIFGRDLIDLWQRETVDCSAVRIRSDAQTGLYFITYADGEHLFSYWRTGSAASRITRADVPFDLIGSARVLHASGISQGISETACEAVLAAIAHARQVGTFVSFDTNLRLRLWPLDRARASIHEAAAQADLCRPSLDDARQLTGLQSAEEICAFYLSLGPRLVVLTMGRKGTMVATPTERQVIAARPVEAVDATGAGDAFDGAFLARMLENGDPFEAAQWANAAAALSTLGYGAVQPLPTRAQTAAFLAQVGSC